MAVRARAAGFTLIELLVVVSVIAILVGILLPALKLFRQRAVKVACSSNLKQIGTVVRIYADERNGVFPTARYMPDPFLTSSTDPPLTLVLEQKIGKTGPASAGVQNKAYACAGDSGYVFDRCGTSYEYMAMISGRKPEDLHPVQHGFIKVSDVVVMRDFDGGTFDTTSGTVEVPFFHDLRNLLFADIHVGDFEP